MTRHATHLTCPAPSFDNTDCLHPLQWQPANSSYTYTELAEEVLFLDDGQYTIAQILSSPYAFSIHCVDAAPCDRFHLVHEVKCKRMA